MAIVWFVFVYLLVSVECPRGSHDHVERDLDEGNWIKLGCFEPFRILGNSRISTSVDISTCATVTCNRTQCFYAIRGAQCIGFTNGTSMTRISDDYCDLSCSTSGFQCGGNFGATIYCHVDNKDCLGLVNQTEQLVDYPVIEDFPEVANCLNVGCGAMSHRWDPYTIIDYFPNMTTLDCVTFCTYKRKPYALLGWNWNAGVISGTRFAVPQCACSSRKLPSDEPCDGFCYDVANKKKTIDQPCGHPQQFNSSWSVFCTAYAINDTECAPFSSNFSREDVCPSSRPTDPLSSTPICASSPYIFDSEEIELNCENPGPCHPRSCYFNDTCYHYIGVEYKHNDDDLQKMADDRCRDANEGGRLLAIESEREQHFVADTFAQFASVAPYLLTAGRMEHGRFFWFGSADEEADQGIPDWVTQLVNDTDKCGSRAAYLYLSRPDIITEPYSVWNISCANISKHVCEYPPPSSPQCTPPTTPNTRGTQRTSTNTATVSIYWSTDPAPEATEPPTNCSGNGPFAAGDSCIPEYFVCRNGTAISQLCPVGLVFHPEIRQCVSEAACRDVTSSSTPNWITEPSSEMTTLPPTTLELTSQSTTTPSTTTPSTTTESTTTPSTTTESTTTPSTTTESTTTPSTTTESATTSSTTTESTTTPSTTTKSTASSELTSVPTSKATTTPRAPICHCRQLDAYGTEWTSQVDTWATRPCSDTVLDAAGTARWLCRAIPEGGCAFEGSQPDYNDCRTQGLQDIDQNVDNVSVDVVDIWATLNETTHWSNGYFGHEIHWILAVVEKLLDRQENEFQGTDDSLWRQTRTQLSATDVIGNLIANDHQWHQLPQDNRSSIAIHLVDVGEDVAFRLARAAQSVNRSLQCETGSQNGHVILSSSFWDGRQSQLSDCELEAMAPAPSDVILRFPRSEAASSFLQLPTGAIAQGRIHAGAGLLIDHHVLDEVLPGRTNSFGGRSKRFNSPLVSYTLKFAPESTFEDDYVYVYHEHWLESKNPPVRKIRRYLKPGEVASPVLGSTACAFLRSSAPGRPEWHWSSDGCSLDSSNRTHTVCKCSHLTGFANLMDFHNYTGLSLGLEVTSIVCSSLSVVALVTTLVLLSVLKAIKNDRTVITQNLCAALMLTHILVLTTLNKNYFDLDDVTCAVFGIVLHLSLLISFMWTSVEGLRLCHLVINVFDQQKQNLTMFYALLAYGIPSIIVAATVLVANFSDGGIFYAYVGDEACWLSGGEYKWAFAGPVAFVLLLNVIFIIVAVHFSWNLKKNDTKRTAEKVKNSARLCLSLTGLLGISWLTGYFMYVESDVFAYIFTISNGLQGVVILLFRCLLNNSVQGAIRDQWRRKRRNNILQRQVGQSASTANVLRRRAENSTDRDQEKPITLPAARISSQMSVWSNMTRSTDLSSLSSDSPSPNQGPVNYFNEHRPKVRTFSGTEFSESSSEERNSICSGLSTTTSPSFDCGIKLDCPH